MLLAGFGAVVLGAILMVFCLEFAVTRTTDAARRLFLASILFGFLYQGGAILALANYPWFDPNKPGSVNPQLRRNRAVTDSFEPGSTLKAVLAAAAWEFGDAEAMMTRAEGLYGRYRWGRYDVLVLPPSFPYGGMENPRLTFATPTVIVGDKSLVSLVAALG